MLTLNPDATTARAQQTATTAKTTATTAKTTATTAKTTADKAQSTANSAQSTATAAQNNANGRVLHRARAELDALSLKELYSLCLQTNVSVGALSNTGGKGPTASNYILLIGNWMVLAFSRSGDVYSLIESGSNYNWQKII